jgi:hypothetical protein
LASNGQPDQFDAKKLTLTQAMNLLDMPNEVLALVCSHLATLGANVAEDVTFTDLDDIWADLRALGNKRLSLLYLEARCRIIILAMPLRENSIPLMAWLFHSLTTPARFCKYLIIALHRYDQLDSEVLAPLLLLRERFANLQTITFSLINMVLAQGCWSRIRAAAQAIAPVERIEWFMDDVAGTDAPVQPNISHLAQLASPWEHLQKITLISPPFHLGSLGDVRLSVKTLELEGCASPPVGSSILDSISVTDDLLFNDVATTLSFLDKAPRNLKHLQLCFPGTVNDNQRFLDSFHGFDSLQSLFCEIPEHENSFAASQWATFLRQLPPTLHTLSFGLSNDEAPLVAALLELLAREEMPAGLAWLHIKQKSSKAFLGAIHRTVWQACRDLGIAYCWTGPLGRKGA